MNIKSDHSTDAAEAMSALADGELDPAGVVRLCGQWRDDAGARARWHRYQLIGDVLRSEDLASTSDHDNAFLDRLRVRLEAEPFVLAPQPLPTPAAVAARPARLATGRAGSRAWRTGAAVAAGFVVVAVGALSVLQPPEPGVVSAVAPASVQRVSTTAATAPRDDASIDPVVIQPSGKLIRDARLDQYLAAHQQLAGGSLLGGHAAFLRQATTEAPRR